MKVVSGRCGSLKLLLCGWRRHGIALGMFMMLAASGCISQQYSLRHDKQPLCREVKPMGHRMLVFNPPNKVVHGHGIQNAWIHDGDPVDHPCAREIGDEVFITDSYVKLAQYCQVLGLLKTPYAFAVVDRRASLHDNSFWGLMIGALTLTTVPAPYIHRFRCEQTVRYSLDQGLTFHPADSGSPPRPRWYGVRGESYLTAFSPLGFLVPPYRKHWEMSWNPLSAAAHRQYKEDFERDAVATVSAAIASTGQEPQPLSDACFSGLVEQAFLIPYDPGKTYILHVNLGYPAFKASVMQAGDCFGDEGDKSPLTLQAGHLYIHYQKLSSIEGGNSTVYTRNWQAADLGDIRNLAPVIAAWLFEKTCKHGEIIL